MVTFLGLLEMVYLRMPLRLRFRSPEPAANAALPIESDIGRVDGKVNGVSAPGPRRPGRPCGVFGKSAKAQAPVSAPSLWVTR